MKKKEFLAASLAALMITNSLAGCGANKSKSQNKEGKINNITVDDTMGLTENIINLGVIEYGEYRISIIDADISLINNEIVYNLPSGFMAIPNHGSKGFKIEKIETVTLNAPIKINEDGTRSYYAPEGTVLVGTKIISNNFTPVYPPQSTEILQEYLSEAKLTKRM